VCGEHILAAAARGKQQKIRAKNMNPKCRAGSRVARLLCRCTWKCGNNAKVFISLRIPGGGVPRGVYILGGMQHSMHTNGI